MLHYAVQNAVKPDGARLYLTATPDKSLFKAISRKKLSVSYLPIRYHGHFLPEITVNRTKILISWSIVAIYPEKFLKELPS